jgi:hypothetical protein
MPTEDDGVEVRARLHPLDGELFTPMCPQLLGMMGQMHQELGSWRRVAARSGLRLRTLRRLRTGKNAAVSEHVVDRLVTYCGVGSLHDYVWFTPDDLVALGIWKPVSRRG